jgi:hypothetical protein
MRRSIEMASMGALAGMIVALLGLGLVVRLLAVLLLLLLGLHLLAEEGRRQ